MQESGPQQETNQLTGWSWPVMAGLLLLLLLLSLSSVVMLYRGRVQAVRQAEQSAGSTVQVLEQSLGNLLEKIDFVLQVTADERVRLATAANSDRELDAFIHRQFRRMPELDSLRIADQHGTVLLGHGNAPTRPVSMADRDYFQYLRDHPEAGMVISRPLIGKISGKWVITCARRVNLPGNRFGGVVFGVLTLEQINRLFARANLGPQGIAALRTSELRMITRFDARSGGIKPEEIGSTKAADAWQSLFSSGREREGSYTADSPFDGVRRTYSYRLLEPYRLYLLVGLALDDYLQGWQRELKLTLLGLAGIWCSGLALVIYLRRQRLLETLERLVDERTRTLQDTSHELALNEQRLQALLEISQYQAADKQALLDFALEQVIRITDSSIGYIYHYHEDRQEFVLNTWSKGVMPACSVADPQTVYQLDKTGIWGEAIRQRRPILINDFAADNPLKKGYPEGHVHLARFLTVPVFDHQQQIVAVVGVANKALPYTEQDLQQLELMMAEVWRIVKRLELEQKLIQAGRQWQTSFDAIKDSMALLDADQRVLRCNLSTTRLLNRPFHEIIGRHCWELVHGIDHQIDGCPMEQVRRNRTSASELLFEQGHWLRVTIDPVLDEQGELTGAVHIIRDETERVAADQARQELLAMLEAVQNELYVFCPETLRFEYANRTALHNLGYRLDQLQQLTPLDLKPVKRHEFVTMLAPLLLGEQPLLSLETQHRRADGSCYPVEVHLQLVQTHNGPRCLAVVHDITERSQAQKRLKEALLEARNFRTALDYVSVCIYIKDLESRYVYANRATLELFGCSAEELPGSPDSRFFPPEVVERLQQIDQRVFSGERTAEEVVVPLPEGGMRVYLELKTPFYADDDKELITGLLGISTDITDLKHSQQELQQLQTQMLQNEKLASIGQLSAGIAHEINNPMGFINSNLGTLEKYVEKFDRYIGLLEQELQRCGCDQQEAAALRKSLKLDYVQRDIRQLLLESIEGVGRVMRIVQDLKSFSRSDTSQVGSADLNQCLDSTINIIWNQLKYVAELKREYAELPKVHCNIQQLNQVFMNLLVNASHAIEQQGREEPGLITVRTWDDGEYACVSISDTGCGIPDEVRRRIFEPFFTTKEVGKGTGLGLSISYDIVKKHGGEILVESAEGRGTTFTVRVPLEAKSSNAEQE
jgi:PAS domain S-box-containing protein